MKFFFKTVFLFHCICFYSQNIEIGKKFIIDLMMEKQYEKAYNYFDPSIKNQLSIDVLKQTVEQIEGQLGKCKSILESNNVQSNYFYYTEFENQKLDIQITFSGEKIVGFFFVPHKEFKTENRLGKDLTIKSKTIELKGTVLIPEKNNLKKLVILVHGSGPSDRDETIQENKPFKDIAETLFEKGISSYRFDKRTFSNPETFDDKSTIDDEVTNDVISIIDYFKNNAEYSQYEIIIVGHSLGANLAPRIANKSGKVSKVVLLAGNARPLEQLVIQQYEHIYKIHPSEKLSMELSKLKKQIDFLHSKDFNLSVSKENLPLHLPAHYWKSLLEYNPIEEAKKLKLPILILQGERDYQVTMKDFELWKTSLKNNKKANFVSYPKLNHLFMSGEGISKPEEYGVKGKVDSKVIDDIANFIIN